VAGPCHDQQFGGDAGFSYGWINRELITSGKTLPHMNAFGGEDRFWMGPEGGQFSVFFAKGATFEFANWCTPAVLDTLPFKVISTSGDHAVFGARFALTNYSGPASRSRSGATSVSLACPSHRLS